MTMALDVPRRELMKVLRVWARESKATFTFDDLERDRFRLGVSRAWMNNFLDEKELDGTCTRMMGKSPAAWRFTDAFRKKAIRNGPRPNRIRKQKAAPSE